MKIRFLLFSLMFIFSINGLFAIKTTALVDNTKVVSTQIKLEKKQTKISFFQRLIQKKISRRISQKNTTAYKGKDEGNSYTFGIIAFASSVLGLAAMLAGLIVAFPLFFVGVILVLAGIVFGILGLKKDRDGGIALTGLIIGGLIALLSTLFVLANK